jgi:hypothetical protein
VNNTPKEDQLPFSPRVIFPSIAIVPLEDIKPPFLALVQDVCGNVANTKSKVSLSGVLSCPTPPEEPNHNPINLSIDL